MKENPLNLLMTPRSIATVGAGNNPLKMGTIQALSIVKDGYRGKFYPIHPTESTVLGHKAYAAVNELPEAPDLVMFVVPTEQVAGLLEEFGKLGTRRAIIITAGFRETGAAGKKEEERLLDTARRYGIRFLGPNCMGLVNTEISLNVTVMPLNSKAGMLGLASQSGTYLTQTLPYLRKRGIRFSKAVSVGNEADIDIIDALEYLGADEQTRAISLYIEGLRDVRRFIETAQKITPHKPVLAQYVGGSDAGARAGAGHTGAMAGPDYLYEGIFKQAGIIRVHSIEDLYGHGWVLATQPPLQGKRVAVVTNSGGPGTAMSHTCNAGGLEVPLFSEQLQAEIRPHIAPHASSANPVDLTFHMDTEVLSVTIPEMLTRSGEVDGIVLHGAMGSGFMRELYPHLSDLFGNISVDDFLEQFGRDLSEKISLPRRHGIPLVLSSFFDHTDDYNAAYHAHNIPVFDSPEKAARGMLSLLRYTEISEREAVVQPQTPPRSAEVDRIIREAFRRGQKNLNEYQSKQALAAYGIPVCEEKLVYSEAEAVEEARRIGFPVVLKGCSAEIMHKTEQGLVFLGLKCEDELGGAFRAIRDKGGRDLPVLVSKMVEGAREFTAGLVRRPGFGPCVMFGLGGIFTEAFGDRTFRLAPFGAVEAGEAIREIRAAEILGPFRGMPAVDTRALADILQFVGFLGLLHPEIAEIDLNPIIISGANPIVVDALLVLNS